MYKACSSEQNAVCTTVAQTVDFKAVYDEVILRHSDHVINISDVVNKDDSNICMDEQPTLFSLPDGLDVNNFISAMKHHWQVTLGQKLAKGMVENWKSLAETFNKGIVENTYPTKKKFYTIGMATGESKTQSTIVASALLNRASCLKILIVTRLNEDARKMANEIKELGGEAIAFNSDTKNTSLDDASKCKTVIISHEYFKKHGKKNDEQWLKLTHDRQLIVIDEALNDVNTTVVKVEDIAHLMTLAKTLSMTKFHSFLTDLHIALNKSLPKNRNVGYVNLQEPGLNDSFSKQAIYKVYGYRAIPNGKKIDRLKAIGSISQMIDEFIKKLLFFSKDAFIVSKAMNSTHTQYEESYRYKTIDIARNLKNVLNNGAFVHKNIHGIIGVEELLPQNISAVILDATSTINKIYELQHFYQNNIEAANIVKVRNYSNFKINYVKTKTGKSSIDKKHVYDFLNAVNEKLTARNSLLVVTHKSLRPWVVDWTEECRTSFKTIDIAHFGNITGKNIWKDYDKVAVIGLPHKDKSFYQSLNMLKTDPSVAFTREGVNNFRKIEASDLSSDLVQAMARIRVRNVIDDNGNCPDAEAFISINSKHFDPIIEDLKTQFPGSSFQSWKIGKSSHVEKRRSGKHKSVIEYLKYNLKIAHEISIYSPAQKLEINRNTYSRLLKDKSFLDELFTLGIEIVERHSFDNRNRLRKKKDRYFLKTHVAKFISQT